MAAPIAPTQPGTEGPRQDGSSPSPRGVFLTPCAPRGDKTPFTLSPNTPRLTFLAFFCCYFPPLHLYRPHPPQHPDFCSLKCPTRRGAFTVTVSISFSSSGEQSCERSMGAAHRLRPRGGEAPRLPAPHETPVGPGCGEGTCRSCLVCRCSGPCWDQPSDGRAAP